MFQKLPWWGRGRTACSPAGRWGGRGRPARHWGQRPLSPPPRPAGFTGPPDPLHGNSLYQQVRAAAQVSPGPAPPGTPAASCCVWPSRWGWGHSRMCGHTEHSPLLSRTWGAPCSRTPCPLLPRPSLPGPCLPQVRSLVQPRHGVPLGGARGSSPRIRVTRVPLQAWAPSPGPRAPSRASATARSTVPRVSAAWALGAGTGTGTGT